MVPHRPTFQLRLSAGIRRWHPPVDANCQLLPTFGIVFVGFTDKVVVNIESGTDLAVSACVGIDFD